MSTGHDATRRLVNAGEVVTPDLLNEMGGAAQISAFDAVLGALLSESNGTTFDTPAGGFIGPRSCLAELDTDLTVSIRRGTGVFNREAAGINPTDADELFVPALFPFFVRANTSVTHGARHATLPRWDIITAQAATTDDVSSSVRVRTAAPGSQAVATLATRQTWGVTFAVTAGTPDASPVVPSVPAGRIPVAKVYIPASGGAAISIYDTRSLLNVSTGIAASPRARFARAVVESGLVTTDDTGMDVVVTAGVLTTTSGNGRYLPAKRLTMTADPTNPKICLVYANEADGVVALDGTAAAIPAEPSTPSGAVALAYVTIPAAATSLAPSNIERVDANGPYTGAMSEIVTVGIQATIAARSGAVRRLTLQAVDSSGIVVAREVAFRIYAAFDHPGADDVSSALSSAPVGTGDVLVAWPADINGLYRTDSDGWFAFDLTAGAVLSAYITVEVVSFLDGSNDSVAVSMGRQRYRPGGATVVQAEWS